MKFKQAAVIETNAVRRKALAQGLAKAGLSVSRAAEVAGLKKEQVVVLGPSLTSPSRIAREVKRRLPDALVVAAMSRGFKAGWADAVLPLPVSPNDLKLRLVEWARSRDDARTPLPGPRPGEGILDPTTSFYTFAHFKEVLFVEVKRARRYGFPLALALVAFDPIEGHMDDELRQQLMGGLSLAIRRSLRDTDFPVQYSADRVLLLMPHTDLAGSLIVARRICERVAKATLQRDDEVLSPTISVGVAAGAPGRDYSFSDLVRQASDGVGAAMAQGGSRVEFLDAEQQDKVKPPRSPAPLPPPLPQA